VQEPACTGGRQTHSSTDNHPVCVSALSASKLAAVPARMCRRLTRINTTVLCPRPSYCPCCCYCCMCRADAVRAAQQRDQLAAQVDSVKAQLQQQATSHRVSDALVLIVLAIALVDGLAHCPAKTLEIAQTCRSSMGMCRTRTLLPA
jgi:hypothetical protein